MSKIDDGVGFACLYFGPREECSECGGFDPTGIGFCSHDCAAARADRDALRDADRAARRAREDLFAAEVARLPEMPTDPSASDLPAGVLEEAILAAARAYCREQYDYSGPYVSPTGGEERLERDAQTFAKEKVFRTWVEAAGTVIFAAGRAQAAVDLLGQIPRETDEIIEWLQSHNLGLGAGPGAVLSSLRFDMDALVASWAATEGGGGEDHPKDATATG